MPHSARHIRFAAALLAIPTIGCTGAISNHQSTTGTGGAGTGTITGPAVLGGKSPEEVLASCSAPSPGRSPLRRLSNAEYRNTITDLFANVPAVVSTTACLCAISSAVSGVVKKPAGFGVAGRRLAGCARSGPASTVATSPKAIVRRSRVEVMS